MIRLSGVTGLTAAIWLMTIIGTAAAIAATEDSGASANNALPPLSGPPVDVATRDPKPPRDVDVPMQRPASPAVVTYLPTPPQRFAPSPRVLPPAAAALPAPPPPRPQRLGAAVASSAPTPAATVTPRPYIPPPTGATVTPLLCRGETVYSAMVDGRPQLTRARMCQQPDGSWAPTP